MLGILDMSDQIFLGLHSRCWGRAYVSGKYQSILSWFRGWKLSLNRVLYKYIPTFVCLERFPLPLGAWDGLRYFIVALPEPSI